MTWPGAAGKISYAPRRDIFTAVQVIACFCLFWAFLSGGTLPPVRGPVVLALATALCVLTAY
jgi:hypothetical protein